jgi:lysophospholipase L1-like esterase
VTASQRCRGYLYARRRMRHFIMLRTIQVIFFAISVLAWALPATAQVRILVYGDSNTWGWKPTVEGTPTPRHSDSERWPGVLQESLGSGFTIEVSGLIARTLGADLASGVGPLSGQDHNGLRRLDLALMEAAPINLLVVMLGTNDLIDSLNQSPGQIAGKLPSLVTKAKAGTKRYGTAEHPRLLVVVPPPFGSTAQGRFKELFGPQAIRKSKLLAGAIQKQATRLGVEVFDAGSVISLQGADGVHLTKEEHQVLGRALANVVSRLITQ